jgi:hypothetical protein
METTNELRLISLGYRQIGGAGVKWGKPVGYMLFTYDTATNEWSSWFTGATCGGTLGMCTEEFGDRLSEGEDLVGLICYQEHYHTLRSGGLEPFNFTNSAEMIRWSK